MTWEGLQSHSVDGLFDSILLFLRTSFNPTEAIAAVTAYVSQLFSHRKTVQTLRATLNFARGVGPHSNVMRVLKDYMEAAMFTSDRSKPNGHFMPSVVQCPTCHHMDTMERRGLELVCKTGSCSYRESIPSSAPWADFKILPGFVWAKGEKAAGAPEWLYRVAGTE